MTVTPPMEHGKCPNCEGDFNGEGIWQTFYDRSIEGGMSPDKAQAEADRIAEMYGAHRTKGRWGLAFAIYSIERDRTVAYKCPFCAHTWER